MIRKKVDENIKLPIGQEDETDWIVFRTGEMYLNAAEAAFERGQTDEAKRLINIIRNRAGMPDKQTLTLEDVRNERFVELYIEEHLTGSNLLLPDWFEPPGRKSEFVRKSGKIVNLSFILVNKTERRRLQSGTGPFWSF